MRIETGIVKWFNPEAGHGFISPDNGGEDRLVHHTAIVAGSDAFKYLVEGEKVVYDVVQLRRGMEACDVCKV